MPEDGKPSEINRRDFLVGAAAIAATAVVGCTQTGGSGMASMTETEQVPQYGVMDVRLHTGRKFENPFRDTEAAGEFISPSGKRVKVGGFYYGEDEWRVRICPTEQGKWTYSASLRAKSESRVEDSKEGGFECRGVQGHGFLRPSAKNHCRMEYQDGTPFYAIGVQTCNLLHPDFDGPNPDGKGRSVTNAEWLKEFKGAVNLVRTQLGQATKAGCAFALIPEGGPADRYDVGLAKQLDEAFALQRANGMSQILILYQDMSLWGDGKGECVFGKNGGPESYKRLGSPTLGVQEQYLRYVVARYGAFIDVWEIFNEDSFAEDDYLAHLAKVLRNADPYARLITTNYIHPTAEWCDIITFHEYMGMPVNEVDVYLASQFAIYKSYGKPVQNTEFGNQRNMPNVDPTKWRIAVWTAFMHECGLLFWSMSHKKIEKVVSGNANAYLGPDSRQHFRVLNEFTRDLPIDMRPTPTGYTTHKDIRLYGLTNGRTSVLYVHHFADHNTAYTLEDRLFMWTGPGKFRLQWINPEDGTAVACETVENPQHYLRFKLPPIKVDLACRIDRLD